MHRKYRKPPITEALCEFQFNPSSPWDLTIPGLVYEKVCKQFPKRRQGKQVEVGVKATSEGVKQQVRSTDRIQFLRKDEKALIQVGPNLLAINHLRPYPTWDTFLPLIRSGFEAYCNITSPKGINRVGLRYINRIEIQIGVIELVDYFHFRPFLGNGLPKEHGAFITGVQLPFEEGRDNLSIQLTSTDPEKADALAFLLDLYYYLTKPGSVKLDDTFNWIELAHSHVEEIFEACITDNLRTIFKEIKE